jgi:ABC-type dipeptide/oligopeptide/nickel transport system permease component
MRGSVQFAVRLGARFAVVAAVGMGVVVGTFFLVGRAAPPAPFPSPDPEVKQPPPTDERFVEWVSEVLGSGFTRFGRNTTGSSVAELLADRMPTTIGVGLAAWLAAWTGGLALAGRLAERHPRLAAWVQERAYPAAQAVPLAAIALGGFLISLRLGLAGDRVASLFAGWAALVVAVVPATTALWLTALQPVLAAEYVRAARARGLSPGRIWWRIVLPTALARGGLLPQMAFSLAGLLIGGVVVEAVFGLHGTGELFAAALLGGECEIAATATLAFVLPLAVWLTAAEAAVLALDPEQGGRS